MKTTKEARKRMRAQRTVSSPERSAEAGGDGGTMTGDMGSLAEDIVHSFDARMERVAAIRDQTAEQLDAVRREMQAMAEDLRAKASALRRLLSKAEASRRSTTGELMGGLRRRRDANSATWRDLGATMRSMRAAATR